jgi:hypothetical protein
LQLRKLLAYFELRFVPQPLNIIHEWDLIYHGVLQIIFIIGFMETYIIV